MYLQQLAAVLGVLCDVTRKEHIAPSTPVVDTGIDSLSVKQLVEGLQKRTRLKVAPTVIFEHTTTQPLWRSTLGKTLRLAGGGGEAYSDIAAQATTKVVVAGSFTVEPCQEHIHWVGGLLGLHIDIVFAGFGQVIQSLLNPAEAFYSNEGTHQPFP